MVISGPKMSGCPRLESGSDKEELSPLRVLWDLMKFHSAYKAEMFHQAFAWGLKWFQP